MTTLATTPTDFAANRARGHVAFDVGIVAGRSRRRALHESGSLRVRFPHGESAALDAVFLNTAGGIAGGDRFAIDITARAGASLTATTAAAEKIYRSHGPDARIDVTLTAEAGAHLAWLPQETILFDRVRAIRRIDIDLHETASLTLCEIVVFGRAAMGETLRQGAFADRWRMRRGGRLVFAETVRLGDDIGATLNRRATANGAGAIGTALLVPGDESLIESVRAAAQDFRGEVGLSAWNGFAMARFVAQDGARLRGDMIAVLARAGATLPRIWTN